MRDFIGYGTKPPVVTWPGDCSVALNVVINFEEGAERSVAAGDAFGEPGEDPVHAGQRDLAMESTFEYGSRVAIWRVLKLLDEYQIPLTIFACGAALERNPLIASRVASRGYNIVGHGHRWLPHLGMSEHAERSHVREARDSIERLTGQIITGWLTRPPETVHTRRILAEEGFRYDCGAGNDELPYFVETQGCGRILVIPYRNDANDMRPMFRGAREFAHYAIDCLEARRQSKSPALMSLGLHARLIGRPGRILGLKLLLDHLMTLRDVWLADRDQIAAFWQDRYPLEA
jgi:allantoinase